MNLASKEINAWASASRIQAESVKVTKSTHMHVQAGLRKMVTEGFIDPEIHISTSYTSLTSKHVRANLNHNNQIINITSCKYIWYI